MSIKTSLLLINTQIVDEQPVVKTPVRMRVNYNENQKNPNAPKKQKKNKQRNRQRNFNNNCQPRTLQY